MSYEATWNVDVVGANATVPAVLRVNGSDRVIVVR